MNILIIEDSLTTAMTLDSFVSACGHRPISVPNAWLAFPITDAWPIDLVLLDIILPGMDGYQLAERLRQRGLQVPIIAVTSLDDDPARREEYGIDGYISKPVSMNQLKELLEEHAATLAAT
jgi:two-component system OmpR family response regulator